MINCLLAGVGGQGTVLASKLLAGCALNKGLPAHTAETIGMAQRGGCVVSHVRIGENMHSPLIPLRQADLIIGFEPGEAVRSLAYLKKDGTVLVSAHAISPTTASLSNSVYEAAEMIDYLKETGINVIVIDTDSIVKECGTSKILNMALLGAAVSTGILGIGLSDLESIIDEKIPEKFRELNHKAVKLGAQALAGKGA
ncbi:indolepyruvate oxidoreductase subunit beta [Parasporobacterium paucivorans]|uniref:Indolepyruvate ferredoxin oxidoreductase beta subunit n=1 Tax=Parasporobacterium paucivorans DSM 15970 TaxID=1122934 RepID=A0A1M6GLK3_9FIRM|nr:indolepyruvate oxidoreductase subunit beta [Parasporobacterium paucivorans]SHJ10756.1 indolepyruvate ferredoxin oxidoreductase beta subunit [Parasporobacterium paucivorans DSM 15970]